MGITKKQIPCVTSPQTVNDKKFNFESLIKFLKDHYLYDSSVNFDKLLEGSHQELTRILEVLQFLMKVQTSKSHRSRPSLSSRKSVNFRSDSNDPSFSSDQLKSDASFFISSRKSTSISQQSTSPVKSRGSKNSDNSCSKSVTSSIFYNQIGANQSNPSQEGDDKSVSGSDSSSVYSQNESNTLRPKTNTNRSRLSFKTESTEMFQNDSEEEHFIGGETRLSLKRSKTEVHGKMNNKNKKMLSFVVASPSNYSIDKILKKDWSKKQYIISEEILISIESIQWLIRNKNTCNESKKMMKSIKERRNAVIELIENEERFLKNMDVLEKMLEYYNNFSFIRTFGLALTLLKPIKKVTTNFKVAIQTVIDNMGGVYGNGIALIFKEQFEAFYCYSPFINLYKRLMLDYEEIIKTTPQSRIAKYAEEIKINQQTDLDSLSSMPFQHIMRYRIQLDRIVSLLPEYHLLNKQFSEIQPLVLKIIENINHQYTDYAPSVELQTLFESSNCILEKTLFGRKFISMENVDVSITKIEIGKKSDKPIKKKITLILITDAILLTNNKLLNENEECSLNVLVQKKKLEIENIIYLENCYISTKDYTDFTLFDRKNIKCTLKCSNLIATKKLFDCIEKYRNEIWEKYTSFIENVVDVYKPFDEIPFPGCTFHCTIQWLNHKIYHMMLSGWYLRVFSSITECAKNISPLLSLNIFTFTHSLQLNEKQINFYCGNPSQNTSFVFDSLISCLICYNMIYYARHQYLLSQSKSIPIIANPSVLPPPQMICDFVKSNNGNEKCIHCSRKVECIDSTLGFFCCKNCKTLHLKKNPTKSPDKIISVSSLNPQNSLFSQINTQILLSKGNDFVQSLYPMDSFF